MSRRPEPGSRRPRVTGWRSRSLCLPVLAAAGLGCVTGLAISTGGGSDQLGMVRAAGAATTLPYPLPKPSTASTPATTTNAGTAAPSTAATSQTTRTTKTTSTSKKTVTSKKTSTSKSKAYPLPKPKPGSGSATSSKTGTGFNLGEGPRGPAGPVGAAGPAGPAGPQGPTGPVSNVVRSLTINWRDGVWLADPTATTTLPGIGTATLTCTTSAQSLTIYPASAGARTVVDTDTAQGAGTQGATSFASATTGGAPVTVAVPNNGMIFATISIQPASGNGGPGPAPASMTLSSEWKLNDPNPVNNFCFMAAQFVGSSGA
jgi:hypothetical protein